MAIKILIADDHQIMREGLASLIRKQTDMEVVGEACNGLQAVQLAEQLNPDVIVMDINMPDLDGIEAAKQIHSNTPQMKMLVLSMYSNKRFLIGALRAGVTGYLLKEQAFKELTGAIQNVLEGEIYLCSKMTSMVVKDFYNQVVKEEKSAISTLSKRENEVLRLLAEGKSSKEIALQLHKSSKTIDAYRRQILSKLDIDNLADLVKFCIREGIVPLNE